MTMLKPPAVVLDLDGCVADDRWRRHLIDWEAVDPDKRYERYHAAMVADNVINEHLVWENHSGAKIIFLTARPERYRERTAIWLRCKFPGLSFILYMRRDMDHRHSPAMKLDAIKDLSDRYAIKLICDDREDVCEALSNANYQTRLITTCGDGPHEGSARPLVPPTPRGAAKAGNLLRAMAETFDARNAQYGDNWRMVPKLVEVLFPQGVPQWLLTDPRWHLFELKLVKLTRFAISELRHIDSIHDDGVYSAMIEGIVRDYEEQLK